MSEETFRYYDNRGPKGEKTIISLPQLCIPFASTVVFETPPLEFAFIAKELVVPSWFTGHHLYIENFCLGGAQIVKDFPVILEAFRDYRFGPRIVDVNQRIKIVVRSELGMSCSLSLSVKGRKLR